MARVLQLRLKVPMSAAVFEGQNDVVLNDLMMMAHDDGGNQLSRNDLQPSQVVRPVFVF